MTHTTRPRPRTRRLLTGLALAPLAVGLVACGSDDESASAPTETVTVTGSPSDPASSDGAGDGSSPSAATGSTGGEQGLRAAATTALAAVEGTVTTVDLDDNGWDVTVVTSDGTSNDFDISVDGATIERGPDVDDDDAEDRREEQRLVQGASLDYLAAIEAARGSGSGEVTGVDLDEDDNRVEWDVDLGDGASELTVTVDASTGEVLRTERDDNDDD